MAKVNLVSACGWFPRDLAYQKAFEQDVLFAFERARKHGDVSLLSDFVTNIPDHGIRRLMIKKIQTAGPVAYDAEKGRFKLDRIRLPGFDWKSLCDIRLFPCQLKIASHEIVLGNVRYSVEEFVDEVLDAIVLARRQLSSMELKRVRDQIDDVLARSGGQTSKKKNNYPDSELKDSEGQ